MFPKHTQKYFGNLMADFTSEALTVLRLAAPALEREHGIPESHYQHQADVIFEIVRSSPALVADVAILQATGAHDAAERRVKAALETLKTVDGRIFEHAPSARLCARLMVGPGADNSTWCSAIASSEYMTSDARRRTALQIKRRLDAEGLPVPVEADVTFLLDRDSALADQARAGGGVAPSRVS